MTSNDEQSENIESSESSPKSAEKEVTPRQFSDSESTERGCETHRSRNLNKGSTTGRTFSKPPSSVTIYDTTEAKEIGVRIGLARVFNGINRATCASLIGCSRTSLRSIEMGDKYPTLLFLKTFCRLMNCSADFILGLVEKE